MPVIAALSIGSQNVPSALAGSPYHATLSATGGTPPYAWTASGLPSGLTLDASGQLTGTPTAVGTREATISVSDADATRATGTVTITVNAPTMTLVGKRLPTATQGSRYRTRLIAAGATSWTGTGLPAGLRLTPRGLLTGKPRAKGRFRVKVTATGVWGQTTTAQFRLRVRSPR